MFGLKKRTWITGGIIGALLATTALASRVHNASTEDRAHFATYMITKKLDLNKDQEVLLDELSKDWIASMEPAKLFRQELLNEVKGLAQSEQLSVEQINTLKEKIKAEMDRRTDSVIPQFVSFYNGLNNDQREKITAQLERVSKRMEKGEFRRHRGWGENVHGARWNHKDSE